MKLMRWPTTALAVLAFIGWQADAHGGITVSSLGSPIAGQPAQLLPPGPSAPPTAAPGPAIPRHAAPRPPASLIAQPGSRFALPDELPLSLTNGRWIAFGLGFDAIDEAQAGVGITPPDPNVAASPVLNPSTGEQYFVETVNKGLRVFDQNGAPVSGYTPFAHPTSGFFSKSNASIFDPRLLFDPYAKRFFAIAIENGASKGHIHIAVSATSDPRGTWYVFKTDVPSSPTLYYPDYPSLGLDRQALYLGVNLYSRSTSLPPGALLYRAVDKASMLSSTNPQITTMVDVVETTTTPQYHWSMRAAHLFGLPFSAPAEGLFIGTFRDDSSSSTSFPKLRVVKIRKPLNKAQLSFTSFDVPVPAYREPAKDGPQKANGCNTNPAGTIDVSSGQIMNAVWRKDDLYAAHTVPRPSGVNAARWYQIRTGPPDAPVAWSQLVQTGEIHGDLADQHTYLPTVGVDAQDSLVVAYAQSSPNEPVSFRVAARAACEPEGRMQYRLLVKVENHCYEEVSPGTPPHRWGDYWAVAADPSRPTLLWAVGEYVKADDRWGTWVQAVEVVPECPACACTW